MSELTLVPIDTKQQMDLATNAAGVCKAIVTKTAMSIQGRSYVKVEGWMAIANAHGCVASARDVERVAGGFRCIGEIRRSTDGVVIAQGEGFVGEDEATWFGGVIDTRNGPKTLPKRPDYAIRAMCQTRAISRACRTAFAHVVVLMEAGLETTPAEEMPHEGFDNAPAAAPRNVLPAPAARGDVSGRDSWRDVRVPPFIKKYAGKTLGEMNSRDLLWWAQNYEPKPYNGVIQQKDLDFQAALLAGTGGVKSTPKPQPTEAQLANLTDEPAGDEPF